MYELLATFCTHQEVVTRQNGHHGLNFRAACGPTQGGIISLTLFNTVVDNLVWTWLAMTVNNQVVA